MADKINSIYDTITLTIIDALERSAAGSFTMPWHSGADGKAVSMPINAISKKAYRGSNILQLWGVGMLRGYKSGVWATYKQWQGIGAQVRKGEMSTHIAFYKKMTYTDKTDSDNIADEKTKSFLMAKAYYVFNADQVDGYAVDTETETVRPNLVERMGAVETFMVATGADIQHNEPRAFYSPMADYINMPARELFTGSKTSSATECYYSTLSHELIHWTGHNKRVGRNFGIGRTDYAIEELVAELGAAFLCADLGIASTPRPDHAAYIASWLKALRNDNKFIFQAASTAQKACDYAHMIAGNFDEIPDVDGLGMETETMAA